MKTVQYTIPTWAICPLVNNDSSGITDDEERILTSWVTRELKKYKMFHCLCPNESTPERFATWNDIICQVGDVIDCEFQVE